MTIYWRSYMSFTQMDYLGWPWKLIYADLIDTNFIPKLLEFTISCQDQDAFSGQVVMLGHTQKLSLILPLKNLFKLIPYHLCVSETNPCTWFILSKRVFLWLFLWIYGQTGKMETLDMIYQKRGREAFCRDRYFVLCIASYIPYGSLL